MKYVRWFVLCSYGKNNNLALSTIIYARMKCVMCLLLYTIYNMNKHFLRTCFNKKIVNNIDGTRNHRYLFIY